MRRIVITMSIVLALALAGCNAVKLKASYGKAKVEMSSTPESGGDR